MKVVLCAGHRDIEQATFFLDLGGSADAEVRGHAAIDGVKQIYRFPLLPLGGVNRGQDEVILVEQRNSGLIAGRVWRIQREFCEEAFAGGISGGDLLELD